MIWISRDNNKIQESQFQLYAGTDPALEVPPMYVIRRRILIMLRWRGPSTIPVDRN